MQKIHFSLLIILACFTQFVTAQHSWQIGLQGRVGDYWLSQGISNGRIEKQYTLHANLDRRFNKYFGAGLNLGYAHLKDEQNFLRSVVNRHSFDAANRFSINILSLSFSPVFTLPLKRNGAISLRPYGGVGLVKSKQQMFYTFFDGFTSLSKSETYDYLPNWMPVAGLFGEYALQFSDRWSGFISIGYEHLFAMHSAYQFEHQELPYAEFPLIWQSSVRNIREVSDEWDTDMHQLNDITAPQIGVGIRWRWMK
jgi:hypothetical protein